MKSIKPGRGPSAMGAMASVFAAIFGVIWTIGAIGIGAPWFFALFGLFFIGQAIVSGIYNYKNATGKNRYSEFDIVDEHEESDPFNDRFGHSRDARGADNPGRYSADTAEKDGSESNFCPFCGAAAGSEFEFCNKCGKKLP